MKTKKILVICVLLLFVLFSFVFVMKYAEEILEFKIALYTAINSRKVQQIDLYTTADDSEAQAIQSIYKETDYDSFTPFENTGDGWYLDAKLIYHACGGIDGLDYTNSREALESTISAGNKYIEIDFAFSSDGQLVCTHEWENSVDSKGVQLSYREFMSQKIFGKYTPLSAKDVISYMEEYPDVYVVTDTKDDFTDVIKTLLSLTEDESIIDRFIIQVYTPEQKSQILNLYKFNDNNFLLTLYKLPPLNVNQILKICGDNNIYVLTCRQGYLLTEEIEQLRQKNITIFEHTVNRPDIANKDIEKGINGFYTDFLCIEDLAS